VEDRRQLSLNEGKHIVLEEKILKILNCTSNRQLKVKFLL